MTQLREAVEAAVRQVTTEDGTRPELLVGEFLVIASTHGWNDEGYEVSQVVVVPEDGSESRILGLVHHARIRLEADILGAYDE